MAERSLKLEIRDMTKRYDNGDGVEHINLKIYEGEIVTMLGPSGCGKSTILRTIGGFLDVTDGDILIDNESIVKLPPEKRPTAMVFQSYNLWTHMTVYENLAFGLKLRKIPKDQIRADIDKHWFNIPFAALMITAGLGAIPDSMIESARDVGASKLRVLRSMILPLSMKDVVIAATFVFMSNVGSFTTPYLMGGNYPKMLGIVLFDQFNKYLRYERAAAMSFIIFLICSVSAGVYIYTNLREKEWEK